MLKQMLLGLGAASLLVVVTAMPVQAFTLVGHEPDPSVIVTVGNLEWVWASPCAGEEQSCGLVTVHADYVSLYDTYGFAFPTVTQWNASFNSLLALENAFTNSAGGVICAATYFTVEPGEGLGIPNDQCTPQDIGQGLVWNSPLTDPQWVFHDSEGNTFYDSRADTFLVRVSGAVPEPSSLFLLGAGLLGLAAWRWKQTA